MAIKERDVYLFISVLTGYSTLLNCEKLQLSQLSDEGGGACGDEEGVSAGNCSPAAEPLAAAGGDEVTGSKLSVHWQVVFILSSIMFMGFIFWLTWRFVRARQLNQQRIRQHHINILRSPDSISSSPDHHQQGVPQSAEHGEITMVMPPEYQEEVGAPPPYCVVNAPPPKYKEKLKSGEGGEASASTAGKRQPVFYTDASNSLQAPRHQRNNSSDTDTVSVYSTVSSPPSYTAQ